MAPSLTMSAADNEKPPRPCTDYSIFFQLERAYILQVILQTLPTHDDAIFHPSQPTYAGLPPLPRRYASLTLAYDWHLPGKEKRRKTRKHRKSHGAIGFRELSKRIAKAWKCVDEDVKRYCEQVCAVGMARYKVTMKQWKRNKQHQWMLLKKVRSESLVKQAPEEINISIIQGEANNLKDMLPIKEARDTDTSRSEEVAPKTPCEDIHVQDMTHCHDPMWRSEEALPKALCEEARVRDIEAQSYHYHGDEAATPNPVQSNDGAMIMDKSNEPSPSQYDPNRNEAPAQAQDNYSPQRVALNNLSNEEILNMWDAQKSPLLRTLGPFAPALCFDAVMEGEGISTEKGVEEGRTKTKSNSSSIVSSKPVGVGEIFDEVYCHECMPTISGGTANEFSLHDTGGGKKSGVKRKSNLTTISTNEPADNVGGMAISNKQDSGNIDENTNGQYCYEYTPQASIHKDTKHERYIQRIRKIVIEERLCQEPEKIERWRWV